MSNFLAIATVTATLSQVLQVAVGVDVPGAAMTTVRPDSTGSGLPTTGVNLYLYQVTPCGTFRNADLPTRSTDGHLMQRPQVALDLHYLLTFYGEEAQLEPQRLLGSVVRTLHARPVLTRQQIQQTLAVEPFKTLLARSNLAEAVELVKFSPIPLSLEELSKLWSVFFQTAYTLSVAYQASVVMIESDETPQAALPVRTRTLTVVPFRQPVIEQVMAQAGEEQPIVADSTLVILGQQLHGDLTQVHIGGVDVIPQEVSETRLSLPLPALPAGTLRAGIQGVQVIRPLLLSIPPVPHRGVESNIAAFVLRPNLTAVSATSTQVQVTAAPPIGKEQRVVLLLNEANPPGNRPAREYRFEAPSRDVPDAPVTSATITIPISGVAAGEYLVRVQVDGAESPLQAETNPASPTFNQYTAPKVTIP